MNAPVDPVRARRRRIARLNAVAQRTGYGLFGLAIVVFLASFAAGFTRVGVNVIIACLIAGSVLLAPSIILGYAIRAAEREDRQQGR